MPARRPTTLPASVPTIDRGDSGPSTRTSAGPPAILEPSHGHDRLDPFDAGFLIGILVGEGHFGGDGRQPQVTLRMHTDHEALFRWLVERFPDARLYGPYSHAGRSYYQWMARGPFLRRTLLPILEQFFRPEHSARAWGRYQAMRRRYRLEPYEAEDPER